VLGVAALEGTAAPLLRILAGREVPVEGKVTIPEETGFVPENRQDEAIIPDFSLTENQALKGAGVRKGLVDWAEIRNAAEGVIRNFEVVAAGTESPARNLSGGNQQRFILGRELTGDPPLLVLENPTQGLDVRAAAGIHARVRRAAAGGTSVIYYSSDLDELAEIADEVLVVRRSGSVLAPPDRELIGRLLLGVADTSDTNA
jgi:simple sugar transport system ATP-binding protein